MEKAKGPKNAYLKEASSILQSISKRIADNEIEKDKDIIENTLLFAVGTEKLLKGLIYKINPIYIMESPDYKYSVQCHYADKIINKEGLQKPKVEVIALESSILRASNFSEAVYKHKNTLMKLKNARDIIMHRLCNELNITELKLLLQRDFYPMLKAIGDENKLGCDKLFFNNLNTKLAEISSTLQTDIDKRIQIKIDGNLKKWQTLKNSKGQSEEKFKSKALALLESNNAYPCICPCCQNYATVFTQPILEFNAIMKQDIIIGTDTLKLKCGYCSFEVTDYKELDHLKITPDIEHKDEIISILKSEEKFMK
ncbi:MAG: hypothetical protein K2O69_06255 [Odoribacter sp.]|nr:hypothetical protein [Odoribacter sp.]